MSWLKYRFIILGILAIAVETSAGAGLDARLVVFQQCQDNPNTDITFHDINITLASAGKKVVLKVFGNTKIHRSVSGLIKLEVDIQKCFDKNNPQTCQHFIRPKLDDICKNLDEEKDDTMANILKSWGIKPKCPFQPGKFEFAKGGFHLPDIVLQMATTGNYWKAKAKIVKNSNNTPDPTMYMCLNLEFEVKKKQKNKIYNFN